MASTGLEAQKRAAAIAAVAEVRPGMNVGLGTGTTAAFAIAELGRRVRDGLAVRATATSLATARAAAAEGIPLVDLADLAELDLAIDGVDEIDPELRAIKGGGGAMLREKIVATAARRMIAIADSSKAVARLGAKAVPLEVLDMARGLVSRRIEALGARPALRLRADGGRYLTDQGNPVIDCTFDAIDDPALLVPILSAIPGVLGHGLFPTEIDALYLAGSDRVRCRERRDGAGPR